MENGVHIIVGCPGTGKTTKLIDIMEKEMSQGVEPEEIAFVSFTKKASQEAVTRAVDTFRLTSKDFPWIRTLHSLAYNRLGVRRNEIMDDEHYQEVGKMLGIEFTGKEDYTEGLFSMKPTGDLYNHILGFSRARNISIEHAWDLLLGDDHLDWYEFKRFVNTIEEYKRDNGLMDFNDLLEQNHEPLPVKVAIIDEAQDLSTLQWMFALNIFRNVQRLYIAGDDDQAIYTWSGADVRYFRNLKGHVEVLPQSYRIPRSVHDIADEIVNRIHNRMPKKYLPRQEEGIVEFHQTYDDIDLTSGSWLLLSRNTFHLGPLAELARQQGVAYSYRGHSSTNKKYIRAIQLWEGMRKGVELTTEEKLFLKDYLPEGATFNPSLIWHEALTGIPFLEREYYISMLRRGEKILKEPRVNISTIHGVKGGEADNVLLISDVSYKTYHSQEVRPESEHRVWYVAATRAKKELHIVVPRTQYGYFI